jgi:hypothetical protein
MNIEEKTDICKSCGKTIGSQERATVVEDGLLCFQCEKNYSDVPAKGDLGVSPENLISLTGVPAVGNSGVTPEKLGGWLWLPAMGLVMGCINSVISIVSSIGYASEISSQYQEIFALSLLSDIGLTAFLIYAAVRFFGRRRNAPAVMIALIITGIVVNGLLLLISIGADAEPFTFAYGKALLKGIIGAIIWIPYFNVSNRVKRTFLIP